MAWCQRSEGKSARDRHSTVARASALLCGMAVLVSGGVFPVAVVAQQPAAKSLVFDGVTVVDVEHGKLVAAQRVVIAGNHIQTVGEASAVKLPQGATVVDARGKYLIPGLWDMHAHPMILGTEGPLSYTLLLANGVTGMRDASSALPLDTAVRWRQEILAGTRVGPPRQLLSGQAVDETSPCERKVGLHTCVTTGDAADARRLVDSLKATGADMLKTYSLSPEMYFTLAAAARRAGLIIGGHTSVPATEASDSGARLIDHTTLNQELANGCLYGGDASVEACRPVAEHLARNNTWWVPTWIQQPVAGREHTAWIYTYFKEFMLKFWAGTPASLQDYLHRGLAAKDGSSPSESPFVFVQPRPSGGSTPDTAGYLYVARQAGLPIVAGTDAAGLGDPKEPMPVNPAVGFTEHAELATYVAEGLTPLEALQAATINPAKFLRGTDSLGTVAAGKLADLVLLDADPLADITNTATIRAVVANGRYFDRAALDSLLTQVRTTPVRQP